MSNLAQYAFILSHRVQEFVRERVEVGGTGATFPPPPDDFLTLGMKKGRMYVYIYIHMYIYI
jgi:hypothetical protein